MDVLEHLKKLITLGVIIEKQNFKEAAIELKVSQSALSQTVSTLEDLCGHVLLQRERGRVLPTARCQELLSEVKPIVEAAKRVQGNRQIPVPKMAWLSLGAYESLALDIIPSLISRLQLRSPGLKFTLRIGRSAALASLVRKGELCMALVVENDQLGRLSVIPVAEDRLGFFVSSNLPQKMRQWSSLETFGFGTLASGSDGYPSYYKRFLQESGVKKEPVLLSDSFETLRLSCERGAIVALLPLRVAYRNPRALVEIVPPSGYEKHRGVHKLCLISRRNCEPEENVYLASELRELFREQKDQMRLAPQ